MPEVTTDYAAMARSDAYKAYYDWGLHHEIDPAHVPLADEECCDGCGVGLGQFDAAFDRALRYARAQGTWEMAQTAFSSEYSSYREAQAELHAIEKEIEASR